MVLQVCDGQWAKGWYDNNKKIQFVENISKISVVQLESFRLGYPNLLLFLYI